jgi:hypothetical protein
MIEVALAAAWFAVALFSHTPQRNSTRRNLSEVALTLTLPP